MNTTTMVPFVKWAGGKRQMLEQLYIRMPDTYNAYYEPFVGGGAMVLSLAPEKARINDINQELVHTYTEIRDHLDALLEKLMELENEADVPVAECRQFFFRKADGFGPVYI